ncbi:hypothetical protein FHT40_000086 [Mycolicibacterium sp. BK556]|uniref:hypothetical protein n=1 Tax=Mycobacteriaceae TaxID=1762 RepID=UPI00105D1B72|nr:MULTISPECIES: hypothetical protein [Mycobacteriaceae]MBB3600453.1 hypothetical protein [Mycolicibacterium sp. BK556]MBB3630205.1 hypothetical protein [Mycolicibacterium sp. BK607]MBB3748204.1 hypothetical protein [Mycolicibacterium sp. BK634]TDO09998.1 hypothetical protein EV580_4283 [Mycobacterium sp. BK086]
MTDGDSASGEALRTLGLMLNLSAIVAFALFLSTLSPSWGGPSVLAAAITVIAFVASLLCFAIDRHRTEDEQLPQAAATAVAEI